MHFAIRPDGRVSWAETGAATLEDPTMHACLVETVERWSFPSPPGSRRSVVNYPYVFSVPENASDDRSRLSRPSAGGRAG